MPDNKGKFNLLILSFYMFTWKIDYNSRVGIKKNQCKTNTLFRIKKVFTTVIEIEKFTWFIFY